MSPIDPPGLRSALSSRHCSRRSSVDEVTQAVRTSQRGRQLSSALPAIHKVRGSTIKAGRVRSCSKGRAACFRDHQDRPVSFHRLQSKPYQASMAVRPARQATKEMGTSLLRSSLAHGLVDEVLQASAKTRMFASSSGTFSKPVSPGRVVELVQRIMKKLKKFVFECGDLPFTATGDAETFSLSPARSFSARRARS